MLSRNWEASPGSFKLMLPPIQHLKEKKLFSLEKKKILKIKRGIFFCFSLALFFLPPAGWPFSLIEKYQPPQVLGFAQILPPPADYPVNVAGKKPPAIEAKAFIVLDRQSGVILHEENARISLLPASTVKIMTALVALDHYRLEEVLTVGNFNIQKQKMNLVAGEKITVSDLLYGLLVSSANDAAIVLAQNYPGGEAGFVKAMNIKARDWHLESTYYANPTGLDSDESGKLLPARSLTSAFDLAFLTRKALENNFFREIVKTREKTVKSVDGKIVHRLFNVNQLLGNLEGVHGVKTGWTEEAGECFVGYTERNGRGVITAVLGSRDRFGDTAKLVDWVFTSYVWQSVAPVLSAKGF